MMSNSFKQTGYKTPPSDVHVQSLYPKHSSAIKLCSQALFCMFPLNDATCQNPNHGFLDQDTKEVLGSIPTNVNKNDRFEEKRNLCINTRLHNDSLSTLSKCHLYTDHNND